MKHNIEIKAAASDFIYQQKIAEQISDTSVEILIQEDTFFILNDGRLKLREFSENHAELIFYKRSDTKEAKQSGYNIFPTDNPQLLKRTLTMALGIVGVVKKTRYLYHIGQTRIHFDEVNNLGHFIELEYVLEPNEAIENGQNVIEKLMRDLKILPKDLISEAYIDLLLAD